MDWSAIEEAWQLEFPADYKEIIARYGDVLLGNYLEVLAPGAFTPDTCDEPDAPLGGMGFITADTRATWADTAPAGLDIESEELVTWGVASSADLFCWLARGEPAEWPVVVFSHGDDVWTQHDLGIAEFLCRVLQARPGVEVMTDSPLWGQKRPPYASEAERRRAREAWGPEE
ncbi:SMI1/KNR4 family protein [Streptomyces sp. NPDC052052]|uniref:SMI1/KNR4 family protein n=1 Tax=Streptomyces sp. NPDC052052 TaxID=3154756 RepID=UPI003418FBD8